MPKKKTGLKKMGCILMGLLLFSCAAFAQRTVTGKVINKSTQQPVAGATVHGKRNCYCDPNGYFRTL